MAGQDVSVDAIVGGGDLAVRKPGPVVVGDAAGEGLGGATDSLRGLSVPMQLLCMVQPEALGVLER